MPARLSVRSLLLCLLSICALAVIGADRASADCGPFCTSVTNDSPSSYFPMTTTAPTDASGNNHNGSWTAGSPSLIAGALAAEPPNYGWNPDNTGLKIANPGANFTLEFWLRVR